MLKFFNKSSTSQNTLLLSQLKQSFLTKVPSLRFNSSVFVQDTTSCNSPTFQNHTSSAPQHTPMRPKEVVWKNPMQNTIWTSTETKSVEYSHRSPKEFIDYLAYYAVKTARTCYDTISFYKKSTITEQTILNRAIFLETIAGGK